MKKNIIGTGLTGLVGSKIVSMLSDTCEFENLSRSAGVDILNKQQVMDKIQSSNADVVLHLAAKADVDACEKDKLQDREGEAWKVNVTGTENIVDACMKTNKKIIYISTDFVFDGEKPVGEYYTEEDIPHPVNWYGQTKFEAEKVIQNAKIPYTIVRIAFPYGNPDAQKKDFIRAIADRLKLNQPVFGVADQVITPTYIEDIAFALKILLDYTESGIIHVVGSESLTPFEAANRIAQALGVSSQLISKTTRKEFFKDRAMRPFNLALKNDKIQKLEIQMRTFQQGLQILKENL